MCGLAGAVGVADERTIESMGALLAHRGPDDAGHWLSTDGTPVMLASRRLSIQDLSPAGHMPMRSQDGRYVIAYNGEVYNFRELREELRAAGRTFRSDSDTEVVLEAYARWGAAALERFNGMFAIAIWDTTTEELFLARDRVGIKPLYYARDGARLVFGSEVKALFASGLCTPAVSRSALESFLRYQYVPWPDTLFEGVAKLPPAHWAVFAKGELRLERYWQPPDAGGGAPPSSEELGELLADAVRARLVSDVPIGVFLSGGIDSALVAGLTARDLPGVITYTVGFDTGGERFDETGPARVVADLLGVENREVLCTADDATEWLPRLLWHLDEPVADNLIYPFFALSRAARGEFTVALSGEGSDEIFHGYRYYTLEGARSRFRRFLPRFLRRPLARWAARDDRPRDPKLRALLFATADTPRDAFHAWSGSFFDPAELAELTGSPPAGAVEASMDARLPEVNLGAAGDVSPNYDFHFRMVDYILAIRDKMSMAVGLEVRTPFLDHRLVEAAYRVPFGAKVEGGVTKRILREVVARLFPAEVAARKKVPFAAPVHRWLGPLSERYLDDSELVRDGVLRPAGVRRWRAVDGEGSARTPHKLWSLIVLEVWYRVFVTGSLEPQVPERVVR